MESYLVRISNICMLHWSWWGRNAHQDQEERSFRMAAWCYFFNLHKERQVVSPLKVIQFRFLDFFHNKAQIHIITPPQLPPPFPLISPPIPFNSYFNDCHLHGRAFILCSCCGKASVCFSRENNAPEPQRHTLALQVAITIQVLLVVLQAIMGLWKKEGPYSSCFSATRPPPPSFFLPDKGKCLPRTITLRNS